MKRAKRLGLVLGALAGALLTAPLMAVLLLGNRLMGLPFPPYDLFDWVGRVLPGPVVTFGIDGMIDLMRLVGLDVADTAKLAERSLALIQFFGGGVVVAALFFAFLGLRRARAGHLDGLAAGVLLGLPVIVISLSISQARVSPLLSGAWLVVLFLAWGLFLAWAHRRTVAAAAEAGGERSVESLDRRRFLVRLGAASATVTVAGAGVASFLARGERESVSAASMAHRTETGKGTPFPNAMDPVMPAPGTRPEYTPLKDHYSVFIRTEPTVLEAADWVLPITGLVERPMRLTLEDLRTKYPVHDQYVTISCISGRVGTGLIGTTLWTGARLADVLADAGLQEGARYLDITAGDGYHETLDLELLDTEERVLLCYGWDGHPLPVDHGFPLRIWIPDRYGMKQPKWITGIEVTDTYRKGYWVERKWDKNAIVKATSVVDTVAVQAAVEMNGETLVPVGGIAFAGVRGISRVEVRVDGGPWQETRLRSPLSESTWVVWRWDWPFEEGEHTFEVRCAEGDGTPQIEEKHGNRPSGASGLHHETVEA